MLVFSNNNYDFLLRDAMWSTNAWGKLAPRPVLHRQGSHPVRPEKGVNLYRRFGTGWIPAGEVPSQRVVRETWPPRFSIQTYRTRSRSDIGSLLGVDWNGAATFASISTHISVLIDCTAVIDERCWMVVFIESFAVSVSVCVVLYRCVCLLSFGFNISF